MTQIKMLIFTTKGTRYMIPLHTIIEVEEYAHNKETIGLISTNGKYIIDTSFDEFKKKVSDLLHDRRSMVVLDEEEERPWLPKKGPIIPIEEPKVGM